jgi:hypothetical protein
MDKVRESQTQASIDAFYQKNGPCCAGCDWWRWLNAVCGECIRHAPDPSHNAIEMLGITYTSLPKVSAMLTLRDHYCGDFEDTPNDQ